MIFVPFLFTSKRHDIKKQNHDNIYDDFICSPEMGRNFYISTVRYFSNTEVEVSGVEYWDGFHLHSTWSIFNSISPNGIFFLSVGVFVCGGRERVVDRKGEKMRDGRKGNTDGRM